MKAYNFVRKILISDQKCTCRRRWGWRSTEQPKRVYLGYSFTLLQQSPESATGSYIWFLTAWLA